MKKQGEKFTGPFFIVGLERSGTKLIRGLLNEHHNVGIPEVETNILPYWVKHWQGYGDLSEKSKFKKFYKKMINTQYFIYMFSNLGRVIQEEAWFNMCKSFTPDGVFEALVRHDANVDYESNRIWGDKSPSYLVELPLIKDLFPKAKFIHIIRDVRDYCLSINKAWEKNMIRAAQRWVDSINIARMHANNFPDDYIEIKYEDLLEDTQIILERVCSFLGLEFEAQMLYLSKATENIGDSKGKKEIVSNNKEKYLKFMKDPIRQNIEAIAAPMLKSCGYPQGYSGKTLRLSKKLMLFYKVLDGLNFFLTNIKREGLIKALKITFWMKFLYR